MERAQPREARPVDCEVSPDEEQEDLPDISPAGVHQVWTCQNFKLQVRQYPCQRVRSRFQLPLTFSDLQPTQAMTRRTAASSVRWNESSGCVVISGLPSPYVGLREVGRDETPSG